VVVPVYNEVDGIERFHQRCAAAMSGLHEDTFEIVYVDDGSRDGSWDRLKSIAEADSRVRAIRFSRNFGHQVAITAGYDYAGGDTVTTIDSDLQDPPELIPDMIDRWRDGADIVYAVRTQRHGETTFKRGSASVFYRLLRRLSDVDIPVDVGDFRLMSRRAVDALHSMPEQHRYVRGMVAWLGYRTDSVGFVRDARVTGETKYPLNKMLKFATDGLIAFSVRPLRIATWLGLIASSVAFAAAVALVFMRLTGAITTVQGWTSLAVLVLLVSGVQLMTIGALGEYVGRIYTEVRHRPLYLVAEALGSPESAFPDERLPDTAPA